MEIPSLLYFSFWSVITITFLSLGFKSLNHEDDDDDNRPHFSPLVIFLLQRSLTTYVCHSSTYALVHRPHSKTSLTTHLKISILGFSLPLYLYIISGPIPFHLILSYALSLAVLITLLLFFSGGEDKEVDFGVYVDFFVRLLVFSLTVKKDRFFPLFVLVVSFSTAGVSAIFDAPYDVLQESTVTAEIKKRSYVEIGCSILAGVCLHNLLRIKLFSDVLALLCFDVSWIGCVAMVMPRRDFGVVDLIVCNVLVGCVNGFGVFTGPTLFAYVVSVAIFVWYPKVRSVKFVRGRDFVLW